jgi:hypothetical protein
MTNLRFGIRDLRCGIVVAAVGLGFAPPPSVVLRTLV